MESAVITGAAANATLGTEGLQSALATYAPSWFLEAVSVAVSNASQEQRGSQAVPAAPVTVVARSAPTSFAWGSMLQLTTGVCTTAGLAYKLYRRAQDHHTYITVTEELVLPPETTGEFVEVCMPLTGEIRVDSSTLAHCKYALKLNASLKADHGRVKEDSNMRARSVRNAVALAKVNRSELCDSWLSDYSGNLHFCPPCVTHNALLMSYASTSHESLQPAVSVQECYVEPASSQTTHRLTFNLHVYSSAMDVSVTMALPKGSQVLKVSTGGRGSLSASSSAPHELTWHVGTFSRDLDDGEGTTNGRKKMSTVLRKEGFTRQEGETQYDTIPDFTAHGRAQRSAPTSLNEEVDLSCTMGAGATLNGAAAVEMLAHEQMLAMSERSSQIVPFELIYLINVREAERDINKRRTPSQATAAAMANNRRERREMERERKRRAKRQGNPKDAYRTNAAVAEIPTDEDEDDPGMYREPEEDLMDSSHITFDPSEHTPGVHLSYSTNVSASGLAIRKLLTSSEARNYNILEDLLGEAQPSDANAEPVIYTRNQKAARFALNAAAKVYFSLHKRLRSAYQRASHLINGTPMYVSQDDGDESVQPPSDISHVYGPDSSVRMPPSIVRKMAKDTPAVGTTPSSPMGVNPFDDHPTNSYVSPRGEDDEFVHVENPSLSRTASLGHRVAFADQQDSASVPEVSSQSPRLPVETFADKLIKERNNTVPKLHKKVRYITRFSQVVRVGAQF